VKGVKKYRSLRGRGVRNSMRVLGHTYFIYCKYMAFVFEKKVRWTVPGNCNN